MTEQQKQEVKEDVLLETEPVVTQDGKKKLLDKLVVYSGEVNGKPFASKQVRVKVSNLDRDGDTNKKAVVGVPFELLPQHIEFCQRALKEKK
jgi:hypothetical protein